jgi:hypothetical protein
MTVHFDLVDLRLMVRVAEANNLTKGAEASHISLPAASTRIKNLEESIGAKLLNRHSQGVTLTPPGQAFVHRARLVLGQIEHLRGDLQEYASGIKGHLRVYANTTALGEFLPEVLKRYAARFGWETPLWSFVTGDAAKLKELLVKRMFLEVGDPSERPGELFDIAHTSRFVLVDQNGDVRGYWTTDDLGRGNLINAARLLWKRGPNP